MLSRVDDPCNVGVLILQTDCFVRLAQWQILLDPILMLHPSFQGPGPKERAK